VKSSTPGKVASCQALIGILANWKCDILSYMSAWNQRYIALVVLLFGILMA
jgi:hypothetical protein